MGRLFFQDLYQTIVVKLSKQIKRKPIYKNGAFCPGYYLEKCFIGIIQVCYLLKRIF